MKIVVMGVSGTGKSTVGAALAETLGLAFCDADDLHPPENRAKMAAGQPLNDQDRWPWLDAVAGAMCRSDGVVMACSALRKAYRDRLRQGVGADLRFVHLSATPEVIAARLAARQGHFMPPALLQSQFATLESPSAEEALIVSVDQPLPMILGEIRLTLGG